MKRPFYQISCLLVCVFLISCSNKSEKESTPLQEIQLTESQFSIDQEDLGRIEGIQCNDSLLIVWDYHTGKSFTLLNNRTGKCYGRFGTIGQGPTEIPLPCGGFIVDGMYKIFSCIVGYIAQYDLHGLCSNLDEEPDVLCRKPFTDDFHFSAMVPVTDSLYLGAGVYEGKNQYALFNNRGIVIDSDVLIFNAFNDMFTREHKMLSNQGRLTKAPDADKYAFFLNNSANIDFIEVADRQIKVIKLLRERDPQYTPAQEGTSKMVFPDRNSSIGYIDVTSGKDFVYALYTDKTIENKYSSDLIYVYDWKGNRVKSFKLSREAFYITADESNNRLYAAVKEEDGGWNIVMYDMED